MSRSHSTAIAHRRCASGAWNSTRPIRRDFVRGYAFQFGRGIGPVTEAIVSDADRRLPWGENHHRVFRRLVGRRIGLSAICEDLPEEHNRVTLEPVL